MKTVGERDFAAQETMHHLQSLKLHSSSFNVIPVSLNGSRKVSNNISLEDDSICTTNSLPDHYANRDQYDNSPDIMNLNFLQFATKLKVVNGKLKKLPDNVIPKVFPNYSSNPRGPNFALFCKYQLLKYKPWQKTPNNAWGDTQLPDEMLINCWQQFLQTPYAQTNVSHWLEKLESVVQSQIEPDNEPAEQPAPTPEEWMILSDLTLQFETSEQNPHSSHDWYQDRNHYTNQQIGEMPTWIKIMKEQRGTIAFQEYQVSDVNSFSKMQQLAFNIVQSHFTNNSPEQQPLHLIIIGVAGTGKSYLINALRNLLQNKCQVSATTEKASYNINGVTIHSLLKLPVGLKGFNDFAGQTLCRLQENLNGIDYILIDEYSMLCQSTFGWIDKRCKQATGSHDKILGGKSLTLIGDPGQLPPVGDKPLYHSKPSSDIGEQGYQAYQMFDKVVKLTVNQRVQGNCPEQVQFRELLSRLRKGESTTDDWKLLLSRQPSSVSNLNEFEDAIRLFYSNEQVANYNFNQLTKLNQPVALINARHSSTFAKNLSPNEMSGLDPVIFLANAAKVMLTMNLWSHVGLCNGATGIVRHIIYDNNHHPPDLPVAVIVDFDNYRGPAFIDAQPSYVPICPVTVSVQSQNTFHERQQLPLRLAWALTIHKSQGLTLPKAWIDIGPSERSLGVTYVAIRRVQKLSSCVIEPMTFERLAALKSSPKMQFRLKEEQRLDHLAQTTITSSNH